MKNFDHSSLDGRLLNMFVTVYDEGTVTSAAQRLGVTQSTVSHGLNRLRDVIGDDLFVPKGRGITPTDRASSLVDHARRILSDLENFSVPDQYNPATDLGAFTIAASDYEIELIVKPFIQFLRPIVPDIRIEILRAHSQHEWAALLREGQVDLVLSPQLESEESDLMQQSLIQNDTDICYFDSTCRAAPNTLDRYCKAHHVIFSPGRFRPTDVDKKLTTLNRKRHIALSLPSFAAVASSLPGTDMIALMPQRLATTLFSGLDSCPMPFDLARYTITQTWHIRSNASSRHKWFRGAIKKISEKI